MKLLLANAAAKLDHTRSDLHGVQTRLDRLVGDRASAIAGDADIEAVRKIDIEIEAARGQIVAYGERITSLEARVAVEEQTRREAEHRAAIERFSKTLAPLGDAAADVEAKVRALALAVTSYETATAVAAAAWPAGVVAWNAHHLSGGRLGELLQECLAPGGLCRRRGSDILPGPVAREFTDKAATADQRCAGFGQGERKHHAALMEDLRAAPMPEPEPALVDAAA